MFVLWSSHMGGQGRARHRVSGLEPLIISLSLSEVLLVCLCVHSLSVSLLSTPPIAILPFLFPFLPLLPGSPLAARACSWDGEEQEKAKRGRVRKGREEEEEDSSEVPTLFPRQT